MLERRWPRADVIALIAAVAAIIGSSAAVLAIPGLYEFVFGSSEPKPSTPPSQLNGGVSNSSAPNPPLNIVQPLPAAPYQCASDLLIQQIQTFISIQCSLGKGMIKYAQSDRDAPSWASLHDKAKGYSISASKLLTDLSNDKPLFQVIHAAADDESYRSFLDLLEDKLTAGEAARLVLKGPLRPTSTQQEREALLDDGSALQNLASKAIPVAAKLCPATVSPLVASSSPSSLATASAPKCPD